MAEENPQVVEDVYSTISAYEKDFLQKPVDIVPGYSFDQLATIKRINLYYASRFESGQSDEQGDKYFYNFIKPKVKNAGKNIDFGTKDIMFKTTDGRDRRQAWVFRRYVLEWMRERGVDRLINEMAMKIPRFGSLVAKKAGGDDIFSLVDLRNIKCDPTAKCLDYSWTIEDHYYTPTELWEKKGVWNDENIDLAIKSFKTFKKENYVDNSWNETQMGNAQYIHVREFVDGMPETWVNKNSVGNPNKYVRGHLIVVQPERSVDLKETRTGLLLHRAKLSKPLYKECHYDRQDGRWLGVGVVEDNFETIALKNAQVNYVMAAMHLANLILFVTDDKKFARNILTSAVNGDILRLNGQLARVDTTIRNLGANNSLSVEIENLANALSNSYEVTTGQSLPSGTPFALGQLLNNEAMKLFTFIRNEFALFVEDIFNEWVLPNLAKEITEEKLMQITNKEEMEWIWNEYKKESLWEMIKQVLLRGEWPTTAEVQLAEQILQQRLESKESLHLKLPRGFFKFNGSLSAYISNEAFDKREQMVTLGNILQMLGARPDLVNSPVFEKMIDLSGLGAIDVAPKPQAITMGAPAQAPQGQPKAPSQAAMMAGA